MQLTPPRKKKGDDSSVEGEFELRKMKKAVSIRYKSTKAEEPDGSPHGAVPSGVDPAIFNAIAEGKDKEVAKLLEKGNPLQLCSEKDTSGWTPVHYAAYYNRVKVIADMMDKGVDVELLDDKEDTPLHKAAIMWNDEVVELLLNKASVDPEPMNHKKQTPLYQACVHVWRDADKKIDNTIDLLTENGLKLQRLYTEEHGGRTAMGLLCHNVGKYFDELPTLMHCRMLVYDTINGHNIIPDSLIALHLNDMRDEMKTLALESPNPLHTSLQVAAGMKKRSASSVLSKNDLMELSDYFNHMAKNIMDCHELDIRNLVFRVLGIFRAGDILGTEIDPTSIATKGLTSRTGQIALEDGPIAIAIDHQLATVAALPQFQAALRSIFWDTLPAHSKDIAGRPSELLYVPTISKPMETPFHFNMYRLCPALHTFIEFVIFLITTILTLIIIMADWNLNNSFWIKEYVLMIFMIGYFTHEVNQMVEDIKEYVSDVWNTLDLITIFLVFIWFFLKLTNDEDLVYRGYSLLALNAFFMCFRILHFLAFYLPDFGPLVIIVINMVGDVFRFLSLYAVTLWGFCVIFNSQFDHIDGFQSLPETALYLYGCTMDNFDYSKFDGDEREWTGNILLSLYLLLTTIMQINLLIAILADTYSRIQGFGFENWCLMYGEFVQERTASSEWPGCLYVIPPFNLLNLIISPITKLANNSRPAGVLAYNLIFIHDVLVTILVMWPCFVVADYFYFLFIQGIPQAFKGAWASRKSWPIALRLLYVVLLPVIRPFIFAYIFLWNCIAHSWNFHSAEMNSVIPQGRQGYERIRTQSVSKSVEGIPRARHNSEYNPAADKDVPSYWLYEDNHEIDRLLKKKMCEKIKEMPDSLNDDLPEAIGELDAKVTSLTDKVDKIMETLTEKQGLTKIFNK